MSFLIVFKRKYFKKKISNYFYKKFENSFDIVIQNIQYIKI